MIIDDLDARFDFPARTYLARPNAAFGAWWLSAKHAEWRTLIGDGRPFLIREAAGQLESGAPVAGRKKGIWRMGSMEMTEDVFAFRLEARIAEAE